VTNRATGNPKAGTRDPDKEHESSFAGTMLAAIFAGWLIALIVRLLTLTEPARILVIIIIIITINHAQVVAGRHD
jgi:fructose-specific phosphotransferase system IIC component